MARRLRHVWRGSLFGQIIASVAFALLVAQAVSVMLLFRGGEQRRESTALTAAADRAADWPVCRPIFAIWYQPRPGLPILNSLAKATAKSVCAAFLAAEGIEPHVVAGDDPQVLNFAASRPRFDARPEWRERRLLVAAIQRAPESRWETVRVPEPPRPQNALDVRKFQTLVILVFLMTILFVLLRRITRPPA